MEIKMADIVTGTVTGQVDESAVLRDIGTVRREAAINEGTTSVNIKDGTDTVKGQATAFYIAGQQTAFQNATALAALTASTNAQFTATQVAIELAQANNASAVALSQAALATAVAAEGTRTRDLIRDQKIEDLRFAELKREHSKHGGCGCGTKWNFGPPTGAVVPADPLAA
jgi:fructose-1,6-bisphosphatase